jgi:hypothetical protein
MRDLGVPLVLSAASELLEARAPAAPQRPEDAPR